MLLLVLCASAHAATYYIDPVAGSTDGDGSADAPWLTLQQVLDDGLVETRNWDVIPYDPKVSTLVVENEGAPVKGGDRLILQPGHHGSIVIEGAYNAADIHILAEGSHPATIEYLEVRAASGWAFQGLTIGAASEPRQVLVDVAEDDVLGPTYDIELIANELFTVADADGWTADDWATRAAIGIRTSGTDHFIQANTLRHVSDGLVIGSSHTVVDKNHITAFASDAVQVMASYCTISHNEVSDAAPIEGAVSTGISARSGEQLLEGVVLTGNLVVQGASSPPLTGIACLDGRFLDWQIDNNVVITSGRDGIVVQGAQDCAVLYNTVYDPEPGNDVAALRVEGSSGRVRNNLVAALRIGPDQPELTEDHDLVWSDAHITFTDPEALDLTLPMGSPAVDAGVTDPDVSYDRNGTERPIGWDPDAGAYERDKTCGDFGGTCCPPMTTCYGEAVNTPVCDGLPCCVGVCQEYQPYNGGYNCFTPHTPVDTPHGAVPIGDLRPGHEVLSWNAAQQAVVVREVVETFTRSVPAALVVSAGGVRLEVTAEHPFYLPARDTWIRAGDLRPGDQLAMRSRQGLDVVDVVAVATLPTPVPVVNLTVEGPEHTFFADGVLVHNKSPEPTDTGVDKGHRACGCVGVPAAPGALWGLLALLIGIRRASGRTTRP